MNSLYYFWNQFALDQAAEKRRKDLEKNPKLDPNTYMVPILGGPGPGQIDLFEGTAGPEEVCRASVPDDYKEYAIADVVYRSVGMGYCNVLCFYKMSYQMYLERFIKDSAPQLEEFGRYAIILKDVDEFTKRITRAVKKQGYQATCGPVSYRDLKLNGGPAKTGHHVTIKEGLLHDISDLHLKRDAFIKMSKYSYQNEWRVALCRGTKDTSACSLKIGNIRDIAYCVERDKLIDSIEMLFQTRQIKKNSSNWYGDDRRQLRDHLYQLGDNKAERFIIIGGEGNGR